MSAMKFSHSPFHNALQSEISLPFQQICACLQRMAWAQDQWEKLVQVSSGEAGPSFDPQQEASDAVQQLQDADVVLTSYEVLRQEVHYSPEGARLHSLRRAKKYAVPESPLLSVR